ncbi:DNA-binding IclR family transcriptional regulator [Actinoalloteichus hoggarensis]|uniref:Glycerol operon regulatory protein n=1 Tax=Actinoalloteichus hoggarensis TaxID=1470176 RepID=A0A221WAY8_9PSEU|nr:IclR family transcriptional regulator [Actinoalloteichus hoggarensis]ASO22457.1 HTH-type transcriptional repressor AllR [Actinoalloteichus hoggarensis]MBB5923119.1 DNA-binding IclR family transcriptional regulator [Actinoalloteichus hoggarensis]
MGESSDVPALRRGLAVLGLLARRATPTSAAVIARALDLPRSTTYHLLEELIRTGFVSHLPEERRYGLGVAAFELGSAYLRHDPLERLARPLLRRLADHAGHNAQLGVLHGAQAVYLSKEQPARPQTLVTDVGVRLPAELTASGRAMLAHLPAPQIRALFPSTASFIRRTDRGPRDLPSLRRLLAAERRRGWAVEDGYVTESWASVASAVFDHGGRPVASISVTFRHVCEQESDCGRTWPDLAEEVRRAAEELTLRIGGIPPVRAEDA